MKKLVGLDNWRLDKDFPESERFADVSIHFTYPDITTLLSLSPTERKNKIATSFKDKFNKLIAIQLFNKHKIIGKQQSPRGVRITIAYTLLNELEKIDFVKSISLNSIDRATAINPKPQQNFYCVKMTVAVEIEGRTSGMQTIEERFILIKAKSSDDAYKKLEKKKDAYAEPYLNSEGQLVRWKIESFDDCFETGISNFNSLNNPEGVEVFSKLKGRRLNKENIWDGKIK